MAADASPRITFSEIEPFLALECPFLLEEAHRLLGKGEELSTDCLLKRLGRASPRELWPGTTVADAIAWTRASLEEQLIGFFERRTIREKITREERLFIYRAMLQTRAVDEACKKLFVDKKITWQNYPSPQKGFRAWGQEAAVAVPMRLRRTGEDHDFFSPLIRDLPVFLAWTGDVLHPFLVQIGKKGTPMDGRDLHIGDFSRGALPPTAPLAIATQTLIGIAYAFKLDDSDRLCVSFIGEGGTSLGEWHEAINFAAVQRLNMIFFVENNGWALGTHWKEQTAAPRFALKAAGYGIPGITIFGNDPDEILAATQWAADRARAGKGPVLIELITYRRAGHAHHDDDRYHGGPSLPAYEVTDEKKAWEKKDPLRLYEDRLKKLGVLTDRQIDALMKEVDREIEEALKAAEAAPWPKAKDFLDRSNAPRVDPVPKMPETPKKKIMGYDEAIRQAILEMMEADPRVFVLGEDVGGRYGGAFGVTRGLVKQFGLQRCLNTPLSESAIVGCGVGAALMGKRPIIEMQFADFLAPGFNALVNNAAKIYWRWGRPVPLVVRLPYGGATGTMNKLLGGGPFHSQCPEAWFLRTPGWKIVAPSTPSDAKGLMTAALRDNNPVIFLEAKGLYSFFRTDLREEVPLGTDFEVPLGVAAVRRRGSDMTCLSYGAMVWTCQTAAEALAREGIELEVIDLRTLHPLDEEAILRSVHKTNRAMIVHEDTKRGGVGAELAALIAEKCLWELDAPIIRVAAPDTPVPYAPPLEHAFLPKPEDVVEAALKLLHE